MPGVPARVLACDNVHGPLDFNFVHTLLSTPPPPKRSFRNFALGCAFARCVALGMEQCRFIDVAHLDGLANVLQVWVPFWRPGRGYRPVFLHVNFQELAIDAEVLEKDDTDSKLAPFSLLCSLTLDKIMPLCVCVFVCLCVYASV